MINSFQGANRWLSNFWPAEVTLDGQIYPSVEHAYQAAKTLSPEFRLLIKDCATPGDAKRQGKRVQLRKDWPQIKLSIMEDLVRQKFHHPALRLKLRNTGSLELVEGNHWNDTFWGVCRGVGENHLGKILMKVRKEIQVVS